MPSFSPLKTIKRVSSKANPNSSQDNLTDLNAFSIDAAISAASTSTTTKPLPSHQSFVTNTSFATANDTQQYESTTPAASYFVDSSDDDEEHPQGLNFGNDPLANLSRANEDEFSSFLSTPTRKSAATPTEISFKNSEEATTTNNNNMAKVPRAAPVVATRVPNPPPKAVVAAKPAPQDQEGHFDVAQTIYGATKDAWAWGKTVAVISNVLGLTEAVAEKVLDTAVHMSLPAIDQDVVKPKLKKLDDDIVSPVILAIWKLIEPAVSKADEMVLKPVIDEVLPRVLAPLGLFDNQKKKDLDAKKEDERSALIDASPTPEIIPALN